ncbi:hypothetical protein L6452_40525 [Arctium lappa]|uniref:Uncharacterized protein n=1 Tax=Arctium lappa TaxID=4217 RepID=A0ACB8XNC4_ARCLA|nr:hypothetical protein L6452_40525 [Arctium lappa]
MDRSIVGFIFLLRLSLKLSSIPNRMKCFRRHSVISLVVGYFIDVASSVLSNSVFNSVSCLGPWTKPLLPDVVKEPVAYCTSLDPDITASINVMPMSKFWSPVIIRYMTHGYPKHVYYGFLMYIDYTFSRFEGHRISVKVIR